MHADGYTTTRITDEGCANYNPTQAIIIIILIIIIIPYFEQQQQQQQQQQRWVRIDAR